MDEASGQEPAGRDQDRAGSEPTFSIVLPVHNLYRQHDNEHLLRKEFFHAASATIRRYRPTGYVPSIGLAARVKVRLSERDGYRLLRLAQFVNLTKRLVRRPDPT